MFLNIVNGISVFAIPFIFVGVVGFALIKKVSVYEAFTDGAKEGFTTAVRIIPFLVAMLVSIGVFRASGAMDLLISAISPVTDALRIPAESLPFAFMRPLSGGGAQGVMTDIINTHGPDSILGRTVAVMMGSTETTFYVLAVYFGSIAVKKTRHALHSGLLADLAGLITAIYISKLFF